jgi:hypothetical protein
MPDSHPTPWKSLYQRVLQESNPERLTQRVTEVEEAMVLRGMELTDSPEDENERAALKLAASELLAVKTEKLGWPAV